MADPFILKRGDTWVCPHTLEQPDGAPVDLAGCTVRCQVRDKKTEALLADVSDYLSVTPADGRVDFSVPASVTVEWPVGRYRYDLQVTGADGVVTTYPRTTSLDLSVIRDETQPND